MPDPVLRPSNSLLLIALQSGGDGVPATPSASTDVIPCEVDSIDYNGPFKAEDVDEANGSYAAGAPLVLGQPATVKFRSRLKGAGTAVTYTAIAAAALTAGTASSATLGTGYTGTAQIYRGMPLVLTGSPAAGRTPLIADYTAGKVASLTETYGSALSATNTAAIPANWTYAPTSPSDSSSRTTMHPCATIVLYEDGVTHTWTDCRGTVDFDGESGKPGFATFSFTGIYQGTADAAIPSAVSYPSQSAPILAQGSGGVGSIFNVNRRGLPISKWSLSANSQVESPDDPNTPYGFAGGQLGGRKYVLECDPKRSLVATRNILVDIAAYSQYTGALVFPAANGNRVTICLPLIQPTDTTPAKAGQLRSETLHYQAIPSSRDSSSRDGDATICFS
jgi:hypothetical protein